MIAEFFYIVFLLYPLSTRCCTSRTSHREQYSTYTELVFAQAKNIQCKNTRQQAHLCQNEPSLSFFLKMRGICLLNGRVFPTFLPPDKVDSSRHIFRLGFILQVTKLIISKFKSKKYTITKYICNKASVQQISYFTKFMHNKVYSYRIKSNEFLVLFFE